MSADNWAICPKCNKQKSDKKQELMKSGYGRMSADEFMTAMAELEREPSIQEYTLREDYELHTSEDGMFYVNYSCSCQRCGFSFGYKYQEYLFAEDKE